MVKSEVGHKVSQESVTEALEILNKFDQGIEGQEFIGYPCNANFHLDDLLEWWAQSSLSRAPFNEVDDPQSDSSFHLNLRPFEKEVLAHAAKWFHLRLGEYWGMVTSGRTQGNEQGFYIARERMLTWGKPIL